MDSLVRQMPVRNGGRASLKSYISKSSLSPTNLRTVAALGVPTVCTEGMPHVGSLRWKSYGKRARSHRPPRSRPRRCWRTHSAGSRHDRITGACRRQYMTRTPHGVSARKFVERWKPTVLCKSSHLPSQRRTPSCCRVPRSKRQLSSWNVTCHDRRRWPARGRFEAPRTD